MNFSKSVNSFCDPVFFCRFLGPRISIGGVKSQNEFVTADLLGNKVRFHDAPKSKMLGAKLDVSHGTEISKFWPEWSFLST